jgi:hypothetical protein
MKCFLIENKRLLGFLENSRFCFSNKYKNQLIEHVD